LCACSDAYHINSEKCRVLQHADAVSADAVNLGDRYEITDAIEMPSERKFLAGLCNRL
jgi:hypothetical protein